MNISIIDYIGVVNEGISILMSWIIDDKYYEFIFWLNKNNEYKVYTGDDLLNRLEVEGNIHNWSQIENFIIYINSIIPSKEEIFKEFDF